VTRDDHVVGQMDWDEDFDSHKPMSQKKEDPLVAAPSKPVVPDPLTVREDLPLLAKNASKISFSNVRHPTRTHGLDMPVGNRSLQVPSYHATTSEIPIPSRRMSSTSVRSVKYNFSGQSTYGQSVCFFLFYFHARWFNHGGMHSAVQLYCHSPRRWNAFGAFGLRLCRLDHGYFSYYFIWVRSLLHVSSVFYGVSVFLS